MQHGISFIPVDNSAIQQAIADKASKDHISYLKQSVAFNAVFGFEYDEVSFEQLGNILCNDYGFSPFKYKSIQEGAIYNIDKHPTAYGRIRGRSNISGPITWLCLDVDDTTITDEEMHQILGKLNHHIARTSDKDNACKYRILIELSKPIVVSNEHWKFFMKSIADSLHIKIDNLGASQCFYGYKDRKVYTTLGQGTIDPSRHLEIAHTRYDEILEKRANAIPASIADVALQSPFCTFGYAYDATSGEGTTMMLGAIQQAKELGASKEYIIDLLHAINDYWDSPMPEHRLQSTVMTAI